MKALKITVTGKVQKVYFRVYTQKTAIELGILGFVRNLKDGSVEIVAQGNQDQLMALIDWCKMGSPQAMVKQVLIDEIHLQDFTEFQIK